ncbi:DUF4157 domain-containing protein [Roseobacter sp. YSTF-M11]|uniref:DUF4157 domain-containing protein n=1 Tax=Roseobacter insulae TaxID=2859783 RepID=A0A9X1JX65_9RHOB|nr:DUF4157 domain-containing protein [Roseobacter insulae]MBW4706666.1 DUF4157 domain-containing protein [Roseobacter insulae]
MAQIFSSERSAPRDIAAKSKTDPETDPASATRAVAADTGLATLQQRADQSAVVAQLQSWTGRGIAQRTSTGNDTAPVGQNSGGGQGLPDQLRSGIETLSGADMSGVHVHYNSSEPEKVGAHAYAQGSAIHLGPGQEKHLPHEAWHVVQQAQGRVRPTQQLKATGVQINDDASLEKEADEMGAKALSTPVQAKAVSGRAGLMAGTASRTATYQRQADGATFWTPSIGLFQLMSAGRGQRPFAGHEGPIQCALDGMAIASMSPAAYANWQGTLQCKMAPHGAISVGNRMLVTQYKASSDVLQRFQWPSLSSKKLDRVKGGLVALEGALTFGVALAAGVLSGGVGAIPAIMGMIVGGVKFARGILMAIEVKPENKGIKAKVVDVMRGLEAAGALVGASHVDGFKQLPLLVFGVAKSLRSIATFLANCMGEETNWPLLRKGLMMFATAAHAVEAFALMISGLDASSLSEFLGAGASAVVGGSKAFRTGIQAGEAADAPGKKPNTDAETTGPAIVPSLEPDTNSTVSE